MHKLHSAHKRFGLYIENLFATAIEFFVIGWHKWVLVNAAIKRVDILQLFDIQFHLTIRVTMSMQRRCKTAIGDTSIVDALNIHVGYLHLFFHTQALAMTKHIAQLYGNGIAGRHEVGGRFAISARRIYISAQATLRLMANERHQAVVLTHQLICG